MSKPNRLPRRRHIALIGALALAWQPAIAQNAASFETPEYLAQIGLQQINAAQAYSWGYTGSGVTVGILDGGIDATHPEFPGQPVAGYDIVLDRPAGPGNALDDDDGHGSHVAGIIGARRDSIGMHGVAFDANLFTVRFNEAVPNDDDAFAPGWDYMTSRGVSIINSSLGATHCPGHGDCTITEYDSPQAVLDQLPKTIASMRRAAAAGTLMVFATSNEGLPQPNILAGAPYLFPELKDNWLAVVSVGPDNVITDYSHRCGVAAGWCLAAPGGGDDQAKEGIYSVENLGTYVRMSGTSMASPHVAGAAALVKQAYPYFTAHNLQQTLLTTATDMGSPEIYGWGLLNVGKAVRGPAQFVETFDVDTQGYHSTFHNDINGTGQLIKRGAGSLTLAGANTYTGPTVVQGGKLVVNGSLTSVAHVGAAGALGGSGSLGGLDNRGTVTPGNSVGTLTINGDYIAHPGSIHEVEMNTAGNDQIHVNGSALLNGGTVEIQADQQFTMGELYPIVTATQGIAGRYERLVMDQEGRVFLKPSLDYALANTLSLSIVRSDVAFDSYLATANQKAVGHALDQASSAPPAGLRPIYDQIFDSSPDTLAGNMDQLSGELHASTQSALLGAGNLVQRTIAQRIRGNIGAGLVAGAPMANAGHSLPAGALPTSSAYPLWANVVGGWTTLNSNDNAARVKTDMAGLFIGGDTAVGGGWRLGAALGYTDGRINVDDRSSKSKIKSTTAALYGSQSWLDNHGGGLSLLAGAAYTRHSIDSRRSIAMGGNQTLTADYSANAVQLFTELGYAIPVGSASVLEPYAGLAWLNQRTKGFTEEGGLAALQADSHTDRLTTFTLGLRGKTALDLSGKHALLTAGLGWRHANGDLDPSRRMSFVQANAVAFTVAGAPIAKNAAVVDLGAQVAIGKQTALGLNYSGQFGNGNTDNAGSLYLRTRF